MVKLCFAQSIAAPFFFVPPSYCKVEKMQVLLYNFLQPDEVGGGGVGVYLNNLAQGLISNGHDVVTLSSGTEQAILRRRPYLRFTKDHYSRAFIVNSPVVAPALYTFDDPETYTLSSDLDFVPLELRSQYGNIDVFHFHNIEGLTRSFFEKIREAFPQSRLLFSVHNYHPMCSRVSLWYQDRSVCEDYLEGVACTMCKAPIFDLSQVRSTLKLNTLKKRSPTLARIVAYGLPALKWSRRHLQRLQGRKSIRKEIQENAVPSSTPAEFVDFRRGNVRLFESTFDTVLAVSDRTRQIMVRLGVPDSKVVVSYIGTAHKATFLRSNRIVDIKEALHLCYLGYMWRNKGFELMLEALEQLPADVATDISVTIAAKNTNPDWLNRVENLREKYRNVRYFDGYTHDNLDSVLSGVNLGIVPALWEDNLPQVAIELVSRGIPVLTSDRGGAREVAQNEKFVFRAESRSDLQDRLCQIHNRDILLSEFWTNEMRLFSMNEHVAELERLYSD